MFQADISLVHKTTQFGRAHQLADDIKIVVSPIRKNKKSFRIVFVLLVKTLIVSFYRKEQEITSRFIAPETARTRFGFDEFPYVTQDFINC